MAAPAPRVLVVSGSARLDGHAAAVDELIEYALREYKPAGNKLHLAGVSNGGRTAWGAVLEHPESFASMTVLPKLFPAIPSDCSESSLTNLKRLGLNFSAASMLPAGRAIPARTSIIPISLNLERNFS